jgi:hypothetical protein
MGKRGPPPKAWELRRIPVPVRLPRVRLAALKRAAARQNQTLTEFVDELAAVLDDGRPYGGEMGEPPG